MVYRGSTSLPLRPRTASMVDKVARNARIKIRTPVIELRGQSHSPAASFVQMNTL